MNEIRQLIKQFRDAADMALDAGEFERDNSFYKFPKGCCGDTCDLLAQFLMEKGISTYSTWGIYHGQTHAWLLTDNHTILDITGDQFKDNPEFFNYDKSIYIGAENDFYRLFKDTNRNIRESVSLNALNSRCQPRLKDLFKIITKYVR